MRDTEHRHLTHVGMLRGDLLNIARIDLHATGDDHVFLAINEVEVAFVVEIAQIAGKNPALADRLRCQLRLLVVTRHHDWPAPRDLANLARCGLTPIVAHDAY